MSADREREVDDRIADWVDGRLSDKDRDRFLAELRVSPQLRRDLEEYERTVAAVRSALQAPTRPVQLADRVMAAIAEGRAAPSGGASKLRLHPLLWSLATAAALLVVALLVDAWSAPGAPEKSTHTAQYDGASKSGKGKNELRDGVPNPERALSAETALRDRAQDLDAATATENKRADGEPATAHDERRATDLGRVGTLDREAGTAAAPSTEPVAAPDLIVTAPSASGPVTSGPPGPTARYAVPGSPAPSPVPGTGPTEQPGAADAGRARARKESVPPGEEAAGAEPPPVDGQVPSAKTLEEKAAEEVALEDDAHGFRLGVPEPPVVPMEPLPLVVVLGRAPAAADLFASRARKDKVAGDAKDEAKAAEQAGLRFDAFFTAQVAQVAQMAQAAEVVGGRTKTRQAKAAVPEASQAPAVWLQVADVRLLQLPGEAAAAARTTGQGEEASWIERDWLVEGSRQDVAALLGRLAAFAGEAELQLRTGETTHVAAAKLRQEELERQEAGAAGAPTDQAEQAKQGSDRQRLVLRFRLQAR